MSRALPPPPTFTAAEKINPFQLLAALRDHVLGCSAEPGPDSTLVELALAAAVTAWWSLRQPATIHAAFQAGASVADVAAATRLDEAEVVRRWTRWTDVQTRLVIGGHPSADPDEVRTIRARIRAEVRP